MRTRCSVVAVAVVVLVACSDKRSESNKPIDFSSCPIGTSATRRYVVGSTPAPPDALLHENLGTCVDAFDVGGVLAMRDGKLVLVAEGTFTASCPNKKDVHTYVAVKPTKLAIEVTEPAGGERGLGKPIMLDSGARDRYASVELRLLDRCGDPLRGYLGDGSWTAGPGCEHVAKTQGTDMTGAYDPTLIDIVPIGPGTCTLHASLAGMTSSVVVTVK